MARRIFGISVLVLVSLYLWVPDLSRFLGHPVAQLGVSVNANAVVVGVDPREAGSGVRIGDRFDLARANIEQHWVYVTMRHITLPPLDYRAEYRAPMLRGGRPYVAAIRPIPEDAQSIYGVALRAAVQLFAMGLGILVLLRRPSPASWALFVLLFAGCAASNVAMYYGPFWWRTITGSVNWLLGWNMPGSWAAIVFALYLLHDGPLPRWRRIALCAVLVLGITGCGLSVFEAQEAFFGSQPYPQVALVYSVFYVLPLLATPAVLVATYFESSVNVRQRLRWIIGGFILAAICTAIDQSSDGGNLGLFHESYLTHSLLNSASYFFIAVPVAYAILKHHVIDVSVAISRATAYTALSVLIVGLFALVDLFFTRAVDEKRAGLVADVGLALILGFSFNTLHRRVDGFVDRILFHKRHEAEEHIRNVADGMLYAKSEVQVRSMLTNEPMREFDLTSARIVPSLEHASEELQTLASCVQAQRGALRLTGSRWTLDAAVAVPLYSHGSLDALVLYGLHQNGTDLDAEEIALLERLASNAGAALDRLEAQGLRTQNELLQRDCSLLRSVVDSLGAAQQG